MLRRGHTPGCRTRRCTGARRRPRRTAGPGKSASFPRISPRARRNRCGWPRRSRSRQSTARRSQVRKGGSRRGASDGGSRAGGRTIARHQRRERARFHEELHPALDTENATLGAATKDVELVAMHRVPGDEIGGGTGCPNSWRDAPVRCCAPQSVDAPSVLEVGLRDLARFGDRDQHLTVRLRRGGPEPRGGICRRRFVSKELPDPRGPWVVVGEVDRQASEGHRQGQHARVVGRHVLLVDDVITTGATMAASRSCFATADQLAGDAIAHAGLIEPYDEPAVGWRCVWVVIVVLASRREPNSERAGSDAHAARQGRLRPSGASAVAGPVVRPRSAPPGDP
jgi:hypothetical protein